MCICACVSVLYMFVCLWVCVYIQMGIYYCCFLLTYPFSCFFPSLPFSLIFVLTCGTTMKIRRFFPFCAIPVILLLMLFIFVCSNISTSAFIFSLLTSFFLLRLIFRFNKFVIFQVSYSFL